MRRAKLMASTAVVGLALVACGGSDGADSVGDDNAAEETAEEPADEDFDAAEDSADESGTAETGEGAEPEADSSDESADVTSAANQTAEADRHVIYYVDLFIETENIARASQQAAALAETSGGFVSSESTDGNESASLTLRVPVDRHASIIGRLEDLGTVLHRSRDAQDVTSEVVDVDSRIESQQRSIARIRALLDDASDLGDVVSIESELARREANLDSLLSRQAELGSLTTLATITVTFQQVGEEQDDDEEDPTFLSGLESGWNAFTAAITYVGAGLGAVLPFAGAALVIAAPFVLLRRRNNAVGAKLDE